METRVINRYPIGNPRRVWRQDAFILSTFNGVADNIRLGMDNLKAAGFNLLEFGWVPANRCDAALSIAEELGIDVLLQDWRHFGGFQNTRSTVIDADDIKRFVEKCKKYRHIYGYYVWDEPWHAPDVEKAAQQTSLMESLDPSRMPFTVAIPSYNLSYTYKNGLFDEYLENFVTKIDPPVMSLDYYPIVNHPSDDGQLDESGVYKDLYLMRKWSLAKDLPLWFYYQGTGDLGSCTLTTRQIDMQVYNALLYGAKALQHYTAVGSVILPDGTRGDYFDHIRALNRKLSQWGRTLMALTSTGVYHSDEVLASDPTFRARYCDDFANSAIFTGTLPRRISVGEFADGEGNRYVMILNRDYITPYFGTLTLSSASRVYEVSPDDGLQSIYAHSCQLLPLSIQPGQARLFRVQNSDEEAFLIDYLLEK